MKILDYKFGHLKTDTRGFDKDLALSQSKIYPNWWRKEGHKLFWQDIAQFVAETNPDILVVGQGKFGMMAVQSEVVQKLQQMNIELIASKTDNAVEEFNRLIDEKQVLGVFHLTC